MSTDLDAPPNLRRLKAIVIGMGVLILIGFAVVIVTIANRLGDMAGGDSGGGFGERTLTLPQDAELLDMMPVGERLALRIRLDNGDERLLFLDPASGAIAGTLNVRGAE